MADPMVTAMPLIERYVAHRRDRGELGTASVRTIRPILRQWVRHAGAPPEWTPDLAARWVHDPVLRPSSRKGRLSRLRPFSRWLVANGHMVRDVTTDVPPVRVPPPTPRDLPADSISRLIAECPDERSRLVVTMMVQCGLRCVDLSRALVEDIDAGRRTLAVRAKGGAGEITHTVPIPTEAWSLLVAGVLTVRSAGPIIVSSRGGRARAAPLVRSGDARFGCGYSL